MTPEKIEHFDVADSIKLLCNMYPYLAAHIIAQNEQIAALRAAQSYTYIGKDGKPVLARDMEDELIRLRKRVKAADELARECEWRGVSAFLGNISALVNAYRATGEQP